MELALLEELHHRARQLDISASRYCDAVLAMAHGFTSPYLPDLDGYLAVTGDQLRRYAASQVCVGDGTQRIGPVQRIYVRADELLAIDVESRCGELGMPYTDYVRAILRVASGFRTDGAGQAEQSELQFEGVAS
ncbi:MAG: hypothetical protein WBG57_05890 [Ornithinimicrobium sp.]